MQAHAQLGTRTGRSRQPSAAVARAARARRGRAGRRCGGSVSHELASRRLHRCDGAGGCTVRPSDSTPAMAARRAWMRVVRGHAKMARVHTSCSLCAIVQRLRAGHIAHAHRVSTLAHSARTHGALATLCTHFCSRRFQTTLCDDQHACER